MIERDCQIAEFEESAGILRRIEALLKDGERISPHQARAALEAAYVEIKSLKKRVSKKMALPEKIDQVSFCRGHCWCLAGAEAGPCGHCESRSDRLQCPDYRRNWYR
jgi:hypothetical protein